MLGLSDDAGTTRLTERRHFGPLRVQKPLYPEGKEVCHAIIVHPPGGVVGGDQLQIATTVGPNAHALLTTPGAAKWYKANGQVSKQQVHLKIEQGASLEWLPQETIFFDAANVRLETTVELAKGASYIGNEILCFGRTASGEQFTQGKIFQHIRILRERQLLWWEQGSLMGGSPAMQSPLGLAGFSVCATVIAVADGVAAFNVTAQLAGLREQLDSFMAQDTVGRYGISSLKTVLVARYLGHSSEAARQWSTRVWQLLRPELLGREAVVPRIWNT